MRNNQRTVSIGIFLIGFFVSSCKPSEQALATATNVPPTETTVSTNTPQTAPKSTETPALSPVLTNWNEIPIFPETINRKEYMGDYQFTSKSPARIIIAYYQQEMIKLGWEIRPDMMASTSSDLVFYKENTYAFFLIKSEGDNNIVYIHPVQE